MKKITLILTAIALTFTMISCGGGNSQKKDDKTKKSETKKVTPEKQTLSGTYVCTAHWNDALIGQAKMVFQNDSVSLAGIAKTTYRIKGDSLFVDMHQYEMGFVINDKTLTTTGPAGKVSYTKKE